MSVNSRLKATKIIGQRKVFVRKETWYKHPWNIQELWQKIYKNNK